MKLIYLFPVVILLAACATASEVYTESGKLGYNVSCHGAAVGWNKCYELAGNLCGSKGYKVLQKSGEQGAIVSGNAYGVYGGSTYNREMTIECNN